MALAGGILVTAHPAVFAVQADVKESPPELTRLAEEFHVWLRVNHPVGRFAALRLSRPPGWEPDWSRSAVQQRRVEFLKFQGRLKALDTPGYAIADRVDAAIFGAAMERVHWELEVLARPRRDPGFYLDQSLGSLFEVLIAAPEPTEPEMEALIGRLHRFPALINSAKLGLEETVGELAEAAIARIGDVDARVDAIESALAPFVPQRMQSDFEVGIRAARQSLTSYKDWLTVSRPRFAESPAIGPHRYQWFLGHVALVPRAPDALLIESEVALAQAGAQLAAARHRFSGSPEVAPFDRVDRLVQMGGISRQEIAAFLGTTGLVSNSAEMGEFEVLALPLSLAPIADAGEPIDFAPDDDARTLRYLSPNRGDADYLERLAWVEPRLLIAWDGIPGRHAQMRAAAQNPRPLRRRGSGITLSQGLALYFHQQITEAGLYAFKPSSQLLALEVLRHSAALAQADIRLAVGDWSLDETVDFLVARAGLSRPQALSEARGLVALPGLAGAAFAAYGQLVRFLADSALAQGEEFSLREFNDRLLRNAHVPVALQRWEYLGLEDELDQLVEQRGRPATVPQ